MVSSRSTNINAKSPHGKSEDNPIPVQGSLILRGGPFCMYSTWIPHGSQNLAEEAILPLLAESGRRLTRSCAASRQCSDE
jgi:hypothetical protein